MPSFAAHLIIAQEIIAALNYPAIRESRNYFLLGSLGPDLPYYRNVFGTAIGTFFEEKYNPQSPGFYSGYGDHFHSQMSNLFPMKMLEIIKKDKDPSTENSKLAFTFGYLSHVAADQHIHPLINSYAGSFYVSGNNRKKHRTLEVYQDLFLYQNKFLGKNFFEEDFSSWVDVGPPSKEIEPQRGDPEIIGEKKIFVKEYSFDWFRAFISRAFFEAYSIIIRGDEVEEWLRGFTSILGYLKGIGPYHNASDGIAAGSEEAKEFEKMFLAEDKNYLTEYFEPAKEISNRYILAARSFINKIQITDTQRKAFLRLVPDADLTTPLMRI